MFSSGTCTSTPAHQQKYAPENAPVAPYTSTATSGVFPTVVQPVVDAAKREPTSFCCCLSSFLQENKTICRGNWCSFSILYHCYGCTLWTHTVGKNTVSLYYINVMGAQCALHTVEKFTSQCSLFKVCTHNNIIILRMKTSQELRMLSSVTINCQVTKIVMNPGSQLSEL